LPAALGLQGVVLDVGFWPVAEAVLVYLGIPFAAGYLVRRVLTRSKGLQWYEHRFLPAIGPVTLVALPFTIWKRKKARTLRSKPLI
jgi:ACR3 family arsenite transporter